MSEFSQNHTKSIKELLEQGDIEASIEILKGFEYHPGQDFREAHALKSVVNHIASSEDAGPRVALELFDTLVPSSAELIGDKTADMKRYAASYYDFLIQELAIISLESKAFDVADEVVGRLNDWYSGAASGGVSLLDLAYESENPAVLAATWTLIAKHWNQGSARQDVAKLAGENAFDIETTKAINAWLRETQLDIQIPENQSQNT